MSNNNKKAPTSAELKQYVERYKKAVTDRASEEAFKKSIATDATWGPIMRYIESNPDLKKLNAVDLGVIRDLRAAQVDVSKRSHDKPEDTAYFETRVANVDKVGADQVAAAPTEDAQSTAAAVSGTAAKKPDTTTNQPTFGNDDPTAFQPVFLSDKNIEDLARTGEFDIGPKEIAAFFPTAAVQQAEGDQDASTGASLLDQLAPAQYKNNAFIKTGDGLAQSDPTTMQRNQITDADLPEWEKKILLAELDTQAPQAMPMTQQEYEQQRAAIQAETSGKGGATSLTQWKMAQLAQKYKAGKARAEGTSSLRDVISKPYNMTASEVSAAAVQMFKAGYLTVPNYDPSKKLSEQMSITSAFDPDFQKAWNTWVSDSFKDRSKTMAQILQERQTNFMGQLGLYADQLKAKQAKETPPVRYTDPAAIRENSDKIGEAEIGRRLTDSEHSMLVGYIHNLENNAQQALQGGALSVEDVDPNARLLEAIKAQNPVAADGTDVADQYDVFKSLLSGPRGAV